MKDTYFQTGVIKGAKGSAYLELGNTKVICSVFGPHEVSKKSDFSVNGQVACNLQYAPFSYRGPTKDMQNMELEISDQLQTALESVICLDMFPKAVVDVNVLVLESDGSVLSAALNSAGLALADASIPMFDLVTSATLSVSKNDTNIFPSNTEEYRSSEAKCDVEGNVTIGYLQVPNQIILVTSDGVLSLDALSRATDTLVETCKGLQPVFQKHLLKSFQNKNKV